MVTHSDDHPAQVTLSVPAESAYASVLRTTAASLAARLDFTIDDIEDLRIAIGEASALLLDVAAPQSVLLTNFSLLPGHISVQMSVPTRGSDDIDTDSFAWQVLSTLSETCDHVPGSEATTVALSLRSSLTD